MIQLGTPEVIKSLLKVESLENIIKVIVDIEDSVVVEQIVLKVMPGLSTDQK